jgi:hypothetical protein
LRAPLEREAVEDAQELGLQVKLIVVQNATDCRPIAVAANPSLAVDGLTSLPESIIDQTVTRIRGRAARR